MIEQRLDYISRQLRQLKIIEVLPNTTIPSRYLVNCAIDVRSAIMKYLALQIRHESEHLNVLGTMISDSC